MEKKIEPLRHFAPPLPPECNVARAFRVGRRVEEINRTLCRLAWTALCRQHCIGGARGAGLGHRRVRLFLPSTVSNRAIILECLVFCVLKIELLVCGLIYLCRSAHYRHESGGGVLQEEESSRRRSPLGGGVLQEQESSRRSRPPED